MFRPSAAPRWNNTTSRFFPVPAVAVSAAYTARVRKLGMALVPTMASAPPFRKTLRVIDIMLLLQGLKPQNYEHPLRGPKGPLFHRLTALERGEANPITFAGIRA